MASPSLSIPRIFMLVGATIRQRRRSGIHRVTLELARAMAGRAALELVCWDEVEGRLRFVDVAELDQLFGAGAWPPGLGPRPDARRIGAPFFDQLTGLERAWLVVPEVAWHEVNGTEILSRILTGCRERGVRTACIFYDLIPITNTVYSSGAALHEAYVNELLRTDLIVPISPYSGRELAAFWAGRGVAPLPPISPLLLPDGGFVRPDRARAAAKAAASEEDPATVAAPSIALLGTVEPRKRQVEFLRAMVAARQRSAVAALYDVVLVGSLHPYVAEEFNALRARHGWIRYLDYADDATLQRVCREADYTAFLSDDEGYGLPISESLALGVPCLCADFGAMAEVAEGGGCLTVDVRNLTAVEAAIVRLCEQPELRASLRAEIAGRAFQDWSDYAAGLVERMSATLLPEEAVEVTFRRLPAEPLWTLDETGFADIAQADVLAVPSLDARTALAAEAVRRGWAELLPGRVPVGDGGQEVDALAAARGERVRIARIERAYACGRRAIPAGVAVRPIFLRVLISTFNRCDFVVANVRWLLKEVIPAGLTDVDLVVVDGGSTDASLKTLQRIADPRLRIVASPTNVGMLAGLREASCLLGAEYVWIVGDDDYIRPEGFRAVLAGLRAQAGLPLAFLNFSVYQRAALAPADRVPDLIAESVPVATGLAPSGAMTVRKAAEQTDNLFTAIYTIVWRADVLAAAFDHVFDGPPFSDLVQAVPCTDLILRRFAQCDAWWCGQSVIAGNAHNSWSHWRPRWHGVVMPMAFALAREAGVDRRRLQDWADTHLKLFREALEIAREAGDDPGVSPAQLELAQLFFRTDLVQEMAR